MERWNYWIDIILVLSFIVIIVTALIMAFATEGGASFLGQGRKFWVEIHENIGWVMIIFILVHLVLHLDWMKAMTKSLFKKESTKI